MNYKKQGNYLIKLNKTAKLVYYNNMKLGEGNKTILGEMQTDTDVMFIGQELFLKDKFRRKGRMTGGAVGARSNCTFFKIITLNTI